MLANQLLAMTVSSMMVSWDPGMVAVAVLMLASGPIMSRSREPMWRVEAPWPLHAGSSVRFEPAETPWQLWTNTRRGRVMRWAADRRSPPVPRTRPASMRPWSITIRSWVIWPGRILPNGDRQLTMALGQLPHTVDVTEAADLALARGSGQFGATTSTNHTSRAVNAPAAAVGCGTVHKPNIPKHVGDVLSSPPPHGN